jgi:hypothetical protein
MHFAHLISNHFVGQRPEQRILSPIPSFAISSLSGEASGPSPMISSVSRMDHSMERLAKRANQEEGLLLLHEPADIQTPDIRSIPPTSRIAILLGIHFKSGAVSSDRRNISAMIRAAGSGEARCRVNEGIMDGV